MKNNIFKKILSVILSLCILSQGLMASTGLNPNKDHEELMEYLEFQQENYKKHFDKEMLLDALDYDIEKIIHFVTNKIVYQAYDGVLRGVEGTLIGRAGNAHDQAVTLASMLNDADVEAQIMVGELNNVQIEELNTQIASPVLPKLEVLDKDKQPKVIQTLITQIEINEEFSKKKSLELYKENEKIAQKIYTNISEKSRKEGKRKFISELYNSTKNYRWVRYRKASNDKWTEVHPTYAKAQSWNLKSKDIEADSMNAKDTQKLSIEIFIENSDGEKHSITGKWTAPSANLTKKPLSIEIASDAMLKIGSSEYPIQDLKQKLEESKLFFVRINGDLPKKGKIFDLKGNLYEGTTLDDLNNAFNLSGDKMKEAVGLFDTALSFEKSSKASITTLKKIWITFTIEKPHTDNTIIHRMLFDGNAMESPTQTAISLLQGWDILVSTTKAMVHSHQETKISQAFKEINFLNKLSTKTSQTNVNIISNIIPNRSLTQLTNIRSYFDKIHFTDTSSYPSEINILALRQGFVTNDNTLKLYMATDIISSQRFSFLHKGIQVQPSIFTSIKHGVWETYTEQSQMKSDKNIIFSQSAFNALHTMTTPTIKTNKFNPLSTKNSLEKWWQVDTTTGNTIGMLQQNKVYGGMAYAEAMALLVLIPTMLVSSIFFFYSTKDCLAKSGNTSCCLGINGSLWLAAIVGGEVVASVAATGSAAVLIATSGFTGIASLSFDIVSSKLIKTTDFCKGESLF